MWPCASARRGPAALSRKNPATMAARLLFISRRVVISQFSFREAVAIRVSRRRAQIQQHITHGSRFKG
jgi:hypothetical protein